MKPFEALKNGQTYVLDAPMVPTYRSVYSIIADTEQEYGDDNPYSKFYDLCQVDEQLIYKCGLVDINLIPNQKQQEAAIKKYRIFTQDNGLDQNVQFFNNYRYTLFVPTNDAIDAAIANGLPTWDDIIDDYTEHCTTEMIWDDQAQDSVEVLTDILATAEDSLRIQTKILYLTNFIRYHFLDNSVFADKSALPEEEWVTSSYDKELGLFCKVHVERVKRGGETILRVCDDTRNASGDLNHKWLETVGEKNLLARDISCNTNPVGRPMAVSGNFITLDASSAAVIHSIPGVLNHTEPGKDGRYDNTWATPSKCRKYLERYAIKE